MNAHREGVSARRGVARSETRYFASRFKWKMVNPAGYTGVPVGAPGTAPRTKLGQIPVKVDGCLPHGVWGSQSSVHAHSFADTVRVFLSSGATYSKAVDRFVVTSRA